MPHRLHEPLLVNTIGHCAGVMVFGILLYLFLVGGRRSRRVSPAVAAALALVWNLGSLLVLVIQPGETSLVDAVVAISFAALSTLPAVLLQISLAGRARLLTIAGYVVAGTAVLLHAAEVMGAAGSLHRLSLSIITIGFGVLTVLSVLAMRGMPGRPSWPRLAAAMCLFLFAVSFIHFGPAHGREAWSGEIALHHAGLPLALFVLLQDYQFLLLDTFVRFLLNGTLAAGAVYVLHTLETRLHVAGETYPGPLRGVAFTAACVLLIVFAVARESAQRWLTRFVFRRPNLDDTIHRLRGMAHTSASEQQYLNRAVRFLRRYAGAGRHESRVSLTRDPGTVPILVEGAASDGLPAWAETAVPIRLGPSETTWILLGARRGGRRYLSEDLDALGALAAAISQEIARLRQNEMQKLVVDAELRALQAQINPHFLFNSLNTLYGTISRANHAARELVLNLAEVFRYSLRSDRGFVTIEQELSIVKAYLAIEKLRLGERLRTELNADSASLQARIPALTIQPLVENAVKHGAASHAAGGFVRATVRQEGSGIAVEVTNTGDFGANASGGGFGIGLNNVRARLKLCYGESAALQVTSGGGSTTVRFRIPSPPSLPEPPASQTAHRIAR